MYQTTEGMAGQNVEAAAISNKSKWSEGKKKENGLKKLVH
jgi:hypothetical protein